MIPHGGKIVNCFVKIGKFTRNQEKITKKVTFEIDKKGNRCYNLPVETFAA